jgi:Mrp family chromosome partitioning ATPase
MCGNTFDYVIIDTPPVNIVTDASIFAQKITGYLFVVQSGKNHYNEVDDAINTLKQMNGHIAGIVLNDIYGKTEKHYSYRYGKYNYTSRYYYYSRNYGYGNYE